MEWIQAFHFLRPWWLSVLIVPIWWSWIIHKNESVQSSWVGVCDMHLLNYLLIRGHNKQRRLPYVLAMLIMFVSIIALAGPTWHKKENPALSADNPVMILMSLSSDMNQTDVAPSRLVRAHYIVKEILREFEATETGLMVYSDEPFVITPLTEDVGLLENVLPQVSTDIMPANGDRLDRALDMAVGRMQSAGYASGNIVVIAADVRESFDKALHSAEKSAKQGFDVNVIKVSVGDNEKLKMIADKGNGLYLNYNQNYQPLGRKINNLYQKEIKQSENMQSVWEDAGYYLLWLPAFLFLYFFRKGVLLMFLLCCLASPVYAGWFLNNNQEGMRLFKQKDYGAAAQKFEDARWRGAAAYKSGNFEQAYKDFSGENDITALYNQGNALAKSGKIDKAIAKYEEVLKQDPNFEDAAYNLEYLKKMKQNQQQQQNQKNEDKADKQQEQQQDSGDQQQKNNQQNQQEEQGNEQQQNQNQQQNGSQNQQQSGEQNQEQQQQNGSQNEQQNTQQQGQNQEQQQNQEQSQQQSGEQQNEQQGQNQQQNQQSAEEQQSGEQQGQSSDAGAGNDDNTPQSGSDDSASEQNQNGSQTEQNDGENQDAEAQAQFGEEDKNSDKEAEGAQVQNGDNLDTEKQEKIRARLHKFRDVPEDPGGLLRALIAKEYSKNRYQNE